ncbi:MAG: hypothetical protein KZQ85_08860 [Candidatus Thiodiazotropha sp. (ex Myrtea sp. 'scaly one' KF741663)]|nr:hypothetical protein [Candidatus Thiodiazotropha sp. (ex Myrtea sp. 'scaly one' KF741663)]
MTDLHDLNERLIQNSCVVSLHIDIEKDTLKYNLLLTMSESENESGDKLVLYFWDVSDLQLVEFGGGLTQLMHLNISRLTSGQDRMHFSLTELEHGKISFNFVSVDDMS